MSFLPHTLHRYSSFGFLGVHFAHERIACACAACWNHLAVVAEDGAVYTCGHGGRGRLGLGDEQPRRRLTRVPQALSAR
jgi:alpha-tubulin suppressor-like RCC1 family protein